MPDMMFGGFLRNITMWKLGLLLTRFRKELLLVWAMLRHARTPLAAKLTAIAALVYVISPIDLVPDVLPILGWLDDGIVAMLLFKLAKKFLPDDLLAALQAKVDGKSSFQGEPPR
jgi:uncharacterized membrane protein YkvA (DUF1232 family)